MHCDLRVISALFFAVPLAATAQSSIKPANLSASMSRHELHALVASAHDGTQYSQLAGYFRQQEAMYRARAIDEKAEWDRRARVNAALVQKYPRPVDSAQYLYTAYLNDADQAAAQAWHYDQLATRATP